MTTNRPQFDSQAYITLAYLCTVAVGMMFDYRYYTQFGINIFEYADILDFLLAPVKNIELILFAIGSLIVVSIIARLDRLIQEKWPGTYQRFNFGMSKSTAQKYRPFFFVIALIVYLNMAAVFYGDRTFSRFETTPKTIDIVFESDQRIISGKLIGKNSDYVFLKQDSLVKAIPVASDIQEIIISKSVKGD